VPWLAIKARHKNYPITVGRRGVRGVIIYKESPPVKFGYAETPNTHCCVEGSMRKFNPVGITALEYREYKQNGCIRVKDYPIPSKKKFDPENEEIKFTLFEMLDIERSFNWGKVRIAHSFSFGVLNIEQVFGGYEIHAEDWTMRPLIVRRLKKFGLYAEIEDDGFIYVKKRLL